MASEAGKGDKQRPMIYSIDFETRSAIDLKDRGLDVYANDPTTEVICIAFGTQPNDVLVTDQVNNPHYGHFLSKLLDHVNNGGKIQAWNAMFEYAIWNCVCVPKYGWPPLKLEQCIDTMAIAAANNIPQSLDEGKLFSKQALDWYDKGKGDAMADYLWLKKKIAKVEKQNKTT